MISSLIHGFRVFQELVVEDSQKHDQQEQYRSQCGAVSHSPVGKALIGKKVGDVVAVETQAGVIEYEVLKINRSV